MARWCAFGQSVLGAKHRRQGLPNQDALGWFPTDGLGPPLVLVVADGHGSAKHFRSQEGARLAVAAAGTVAQNLLALSQTSADATQLQSAIEQSLSREIGHRWVENVRKHVEQHPFSASELSLLVQKEGTAARKMVEDGPLLAYGSTLLATVVSETYVAYAQLGDGDMVVVSQEGIIGRPLPSDPRAFGVETPSLCSEKDRVHIPVFFQPLRDPQPVLILASSDGYANSYPSVSDPLAEFARDFWKLVCDFGLPRVQENLEGWLAETSEKGSGDDITLGILYRLNSLCREETPEVSRS